ncbi:MAG: glycosyltransferase [Alphaproteobacteria bacterium]|nr:glycosyltransferase [Alphaproteobacteria bacterium]
MSSGECGIHPIRDRGPLTRLLRYLLSLPLTLLALLRHRPDCVAMLNQPPFLPMAALAYCLPAGAPFLLDCHSAAYRARRWAAFRRLYRWLSRRALVNINHNRSDMARVPAWGGRSLLLPAVIADLPVAAGGRSDEPVYVSAYTADDPIAAFLSAAADLPGQRFAITGDPRRCPAHLRERLPANVRFTGYLPRAEYLDLLARAPALIALTTQSDLMQCAAEEALCLGRPMLTSASPVLREALAEGAEYCDNSAAYIAAKFRALISNLPMREAGIAAARAQGLAAQTRDLARLGLLAATLDGDSPRTADGS